MPRLRASSVHRDTAYPGSFLSFCYLVAQGDSATSSNALVYVIVGVLVLLATRKARPYAPGILISGGLTIASLSAAQSGLVPWLMVLLGVVRLLRLDSRWKPVAVSVGLAAASALPAIVRAIVRTNGNAVHDRALPVTSLDLIVDLLHGAFGTIAAALVLVTIARRAREAGDEHLARALGRGSIIVATCQTLGTAMVVWFDSRHVFALARGNSLSVTAVAALVMLPAFVVTLFAVRPLWRAAGAPFLRGAVGARRAARVAAAKLNTLAS
ncbi:MAG: hypothetical protein QOF57_1365 [Frankiaceae bacterium]|nr:hypothetical protein [Frankiaceae bacterium]